MSELVGLVGFSFVSSVTPGPNNVLLWASGAAFGVRSTVPHILGTALGIGAMALAVAAGLGAIVTTVPEVAVAMKVGGSIYLLYLAWQIGRSNAVERRDVARPLGILPAATFQVINPKAWILAVVAITTFRPTDVPIALGSLLVAATMMAVIVPSSALWAVAGGAMDRLITDDRTQRIARLTLAGLVAATVAYVWL